MTAPADAKTLRFGLWLLLVSAPLGLTLEALHALKVQVYLGSPMRRELWTLAHAHGNLLGILCLVMAAVGERCCPEPGARGRMLAALRLGALLMPLGFFLGGVLNREGDPSLFVLMVPAGALCLVFAFVRAILGRPRPDASA
ncbi:MAG: hypothetical protein R3F56_07790 [Planctomycetota bacterium]